MEVKTPQSVAIATDKVFEQSDAKICRAPKGLTNKDQSTASNKLDVDLAMSALVFIVSLSLFVNRIEPYL